MSAIQGMAGGTPTAEQIDSLLTALCPMSSVLECVDSNSACSSALQQMGDLGSSLDSMAAMKSQCATAGKPTSYATTYSFTPPIECTTTTTMSGSESGGEDSGGADGLLQLNLLAGSFSLFAILNWMWWQISGKPLSNDMQVQRTFALCPLSLSARSAFCHHDCAAGKRGKPQGLRLMRRWWGFGNVLTAHCCWKIFALRPLAVVGWYVSRWTLICYLD